MTKEITRPDFIMHVKDIVQNESFNKRWNLVTWANRLVETSRAETIKEIEDFVNQIDDNSFSSSYLRMKLKKIKEKLEEMKK